MNANMNRSVVVATVLATLPAASIASHGGDRATVVAVYPPEYTAAFKAARQLPAKYSGVRDAVDCDFRSRPFVQLSIVAMSHSVRSMQTPSSKRSP
jgi:hypothetical protein